MNDLLVALAAFSGMAEGVIWHFALVFFRVGAAIALIPAIGEQAVPQRIKLVAALSITVIVAPGVAMGNVPDAFSIIAEAIAGLALGIGLRLLMLGLQTAGSFASQSISLAQMLSGTAGEPLPVLGNALVLAGLALFVAVGGLPHAVELLLLSYQLIPLGEFPDPSALAEWGLGRTIRVFTLAFSLAAPFVLAALLYNLALGAINRAMPTLMVIFIGAPAIAFGGLALMALVAPFLLAVWQEALIQALATPFGP